MPIAQAWTPGVTILVADDDVLTRIAVAEYLRGCGFRVIEAAGGHEAKTILQHGPEIDVLFSDARLAGDDSGFALAHWVRRHRPRIKVILSAGVMRKSEAAARLCSGGDTEAASAAHLRDRIEAMNARGNRIRPDRRARARLAPKHFA